MSFFNFLKTKVTESRAKRKDESERMKSLRMEAEELQKIEFEKEFRKQSRELAIIQAQRDAMKKSGMAKMRALERAERLKMNNNPKSDIGSKLAKISARMAQNRERTMKRKQLTEMKRKMIKNQKMERINMRNTRQTFKPPIKRVNISQRVIRKPFSPSGFKGKEIRSDLGSKPLRRIYGS